MIHKPESGSNWGGSDGNLLVVRQEGGRYQMFVDLKVKIHLVPGGTSFPQTFLPENIPDGASLRVFSLGHGGDKQGEILQ